ncbi:MAG: serine/threonine-protein kinase, partial [Myxococcota bacterium]
MPVEDSDLNEFADPERILGTLIGDRYLVQRCIGTGGMGVVYLAWQLGLGRHVVLKVIRADRANKSSRLRFRREAYNLSRLAHPSVVSVYDHGADDATGLLYLVMEHVGGLTLQKFQRQLGRLSVAKLVPIVSPLLGGLAEIHRNGLIHRDIKAANVMLSSDDGVALQVKIVDFGLSKQLVGDETATLPSEVVGSARSIAPEIFKGEVAGPSADVYAAGVLLYELLAGHDRVRTSSPYERMVRSANGDFTPLDQVLPHEHGVPAGLIELVHQCLEARPEDRPANGLELASRFERAVKGISPDAFEAAATAERARPMLPIPTTAAVRAAEDGQARASARARSPWGLLSAAFAMAFVSTLVLLGVVLYVLPRPVAQVAAPAPPPVEAPEKGQGLYLEWALAAMQDGDYD